MVTVKERLSVAEENVVVREKEPSLVEVRENSSLDQAVTIPPEAPTEGRKQKDYSRGWRKVAFLKEEIDSSFDS